MLNFNTLLHPISDERPCGDSLHGTILFFDMLNAKQGNNRQSFVGDGTSEVNLEETDWKLIKEKALELLTNTHDLEITTYLCIALLHTNSFIGLSQGLQLTRELLEQYWDCIYPELDMDFPDDPALERANVLAELGANEFRLNIRRQTLISHRMLGSFSLEDMQKTYSENPPEDAPKIEHIDGVFTEMGLDVVKELNHTIKTALADTNAIENIFKEKVGLTNYPDLAGLTTVLKDIGSILFKKIQQQEPEIDHAELEKKDIDISIADNNLSQTTIPFNPGEINNRKDVVKAIEKICKYYRKNEPGSPIPLLLERTKRLVDKEFIEILEDLSPDGVGQARSILGVIDKE